MKQLQFHLFEASKFNVCLSRDASIAPLHYDTDSHDLGHSAFALEYPPIEIPNAMHITPPILLILSPNKKALNQPI